jgi:hypothetical protein
MALPCAAQARVSGRPTTTDASAPMSEWRQVAEWDWVWHTAKDGGEGADDLLHAVAATTNDCDEDWFGVGYTECGLVGELTIPGIGGRMTAERCPVCCDVVGMPYGVQSPKNVDECRSIAEERVNGVRCGLR